jgi:hypothetical protein
MKKNKRKEPPSCPSLTCKCEKCQKELDEMAKKVVAACRLRTLRTMLSRRQVFG